MDLYKVLGVPRSASQDEVKKAFRKLALECHPDRNTGGSKASADHAEQRFRAVSEAYEVLGDANKRDLYNRGQAGGYPRSSAGNWNSATSQQYYSPPRARSGWANYRYQQQKQSGVSRNLSAMLRGMTRVDGYFHLLLAGALVGGLLFMNTAGESMWNSMNKGKLFKDIPRRDKVPITKDFNMKRDQQLCLSAEQAPPPSAVLDEIVLWDETPPELCLMLPNQHIMTLRSPARVSVCLMQSASCRTME
ncbi:hypothetical protein WJX79_010674 [Trebouxia sp. C0005]